MKKHLKLALLVALFASYCIPSRAQAPTTEGQDFWVTFLRAADDDPTELKLTISAKEACIVTIHQVDDDDIVLSVGDNSSTEIGSNTTTAIDINGNERTLTQTSCYSSTTGTATNTALHVTSTKDISLFAGNYRDKSFDATNVLPTSALLDDYIIQTYPPSDHEDKPQGSHFAIIAVEDGETVVDYNLTAKTTKEAIGRHSATLKKGQVWYVWTGLNKDNEADLSGTTVMARYGKKIAVFQGCPHTNIPNHVRDRDHIISQAMPTAYWGTEFGITASRKHRRDIVAVMALNDGTQVYINDADGEKVLVHTFNFNSNDPQERKHYWTFEIGEELAYCADKEGESPSHGQLPPPLVIDSSCYLTTSCPAGVHLFMVSNRYDNLTPTVKSDTLVSDPAMLWISPIEQVIKEINFATYETQQAKFHFMNIVTPTANIGDMSWNGNSIRQYFHPITGNSDYSYARIEIPNGNHNLKGTMGFLAHVYGYGERESYAYSCGSSTIQRSITFNDMPLMLDSLYPGKFCVNDPIEMKLNIGSNDYETVEWDFGDGVTYESNPNAPNDEKKQATHTYSIPGWYDLKVTATYVNACTGSKHSETLGLSFRVARPDTIRRVALEPDCQDPSYSGPTIRVDTSYYDCDSVVIMQYLVLKNSEPYEYYETAPNSAVINGQTYTSSQDVTWKIPNHTGICDSTITCHLTIVKCLDLQIINQPDSQHICAGETLEMPFSYDRDGDPGEAFLVVTDGKKYPLDFVYSEIEGTRAIGKVTLPINELKPNHYTAKIQVEDMNSDNGCTPIAESPLLDITVRYPEDIFAYKFNNVLAVYKKGSEHNKDYEFVAYQWYRNDKAIEGATESIYHSESPFIAGDSYYVLLTDKNGLVLPSCPQIIDNVPNYTPQAKTAPYKKLVNNRIYIVVDEKMYDAYGKRVQ
ncbi:MAG: hypothetical protein IKP02_08110 [Paludibacteraceae bacterium]|nr:hypothetical protein [Paludibacteraceae bacterium]